jgi:hypothetical protein
LTSSWLHLLKGWSLIKTQGDSLAISRGGSLFRDFASHCHVLAAAPAGGKFFIQHFQTCLQVIDS